MTYNYNQNTLQRNHKINRKNDPREKETKV